MASLYQRTPGRESQIYAMWDILAVAKTAPLVANTGGDTNGLWRLPRARRSSGSRGRAPNSRPTSKDAAITKLPRILATTGCCYSAGKWSISSRKHLSPGGRERPPLLTTRGRHGAHRCRRGGLQQTGHQPAPIQDRRSSEGYRVDEPGPRRREEHTAYPSPTN